MFATIGATSASIRSSAQPKRPRCGTASALVATKRTIPSSTTFRFGTLQTMQAPVSLQSARGLVPHGPVATLAGHSRWRRAISEPQRSRFHPRSLGAVDSRKPAVARRATVELVTRHRMLCHLIRDVSVRNGLFRLLVASSVLVVWLAYLTSRLIRTRAPGHPSSRDSGEAPVLVFRRIPWLAKFGHHHGTNVSAFVAPQPK